MQFIIKDAETGIEYVECPEGAIAGALSGQMNEWLRTYEDDTRVRVVRENRGNSTGPDWRERERRHSTDTIPWIEASWWLNSEYANLHFPHVSEDRPNMIAYTPSEEYGQLDRQVRMAPGKYLTKYFSSAYPTNGPLCEWDIRSFVTTYMALNAPDWVPELKLHTTPDAIEKAYVDGPHFGSCMAYEADNFDGGEHPVRVYGAGDLACATVEDEDGDVIGRCIVWPDRKVFNRIYAQDSGPMLNALTAAGYKQGSIRGAKLLKIEAYCGGFVMPYIDGDGSVADMGDHFVIGGDIWADSTRGVIMGISCEDCGDSIDPDYVFYGPDEVNRCEYCHCDAVFTCQGCWDDHMQYDGVRGPDNELRCQDCHDEVVRECVDCDQMVMEDEVLYGPDDEARCESCHMDNVHHCENCEDEVLKDDIVDGPDGAARCQDCHDDCVVECESCGIERLREAECDDCLELELA